FGAALMNNREQSAAGAMHGKVFQSSRAPVLRELLRGEQRPGGLRLDAGGCCAQRMEYALEGCEEPRISAAYPFLAERILQHVDELGRAFVMCQCARVGECRRE